MNNTRVRDLKSISDRVFDQLARFECECSAGTGRYFPCSKPATKVIEWRHQDGDRERGALCQEHALEQQQYWSAMDWDTGVEISDIEEWQLGICFCGRSGTRVGSRFRDTAA
jgi:hypothetical protein